MSRTIVLGAGISGLWLGRRLQEMGRDFVVLEKEPVVGGLCRTNVTGGHSWDFGVHAMYSRHPEANELFGRMPLEYRRSDRDVKVLCTQGGRARYLVDYPFENGVHALPAADKWECILGYAWARMRRRPTSNLQEWIDDGLGRGIARHFMTPYNRKIWNCELTRISKDLVNSKIEPAGVLSFLKGALRGGTVGREYQAKFLYPARGIQALPDHLASPIRPRLRLGAPVERLERHGGRWIVTAGGVSYEGDRVVSTIPLPELLRRVRIDGVPDRLPELVWNDTHFVLVGLKRGARFGVVGRCHWVFFPGDEIYYRATLMHNFDADLPPALVAEITASPRTAGLDRSSLIERVVADLLRAGIVESPADVAVTDSKRLDYTYPIPTMGLRDPLDRTRAALEASGVLLLGRGGAWRYLNIDGALIEADRFARRHFGGGR